MHDVEALQHLIRKIMFMNYVPAPQCISNTPITLLYQGKGRVGQTKSKQQGGLSCANTQNGLEASGTTQ